jgi:hypothetical protein
MDDKTADRIARALERIADNLSFLADERLRQIARDKTREMERGENSKAPWPRAAE